MGTEQNSMQLHCVGDAVFHPIVENWFRQRFGEPTEAQRRGWPEITAGRNTLIAAPTGSGKTLAAFLACLDRLLREAIAGTLTDVTRVVYISPLKALSNDIHRNLGSAAGGVGSGHDRSGLSADADSRSGPNRRYAAARTGGHVASAAAFAGDHAGVAVFVADQHERARNAAQRGNGDRR